jgi:hypothetical protein
MGRLGMCALPMLVFMLAAGPAGASESSACEARATLAVARPISGQCDSLPKLRLRLAKRPRFPARSLTISQLPTSARPLFSSADGGFPPPARNAILPDALLVAPAPETIPLLATIGIPAISGVPPIVILDGQRIRPPLVDDPAKDQRNGGPQ